jgi:HEAT repeat protein
VFQHQDSVYDAAIREAAIAIHELGEQAKGEAARKIFEITQAPPEKQVTGNRAISQLLALVWLADEAEFSQARKTMDPGFQQRWPSVAILAGLQSADDEAAFLIECLTASEKKAIDRKVQEWIVFRLGDLKDTRAVPAIAALVEHPYSRSPLMLQAALTSIGGAEAEAAMLKLLTHKEPSVRRMATNIICDLLGPEAMPLCRRILNEENFGSKVDALYPIGRHGTLEDLELLEELCDYWTGDRSLTYHGGSAMTQIRERIHHDLNGPIVRAGELH